MTCDQPAGTQHIDVVWYESLSLFLLYIVYALVCSFYNSHILPALCGRVGTGSGGEGGDDDAAYKEMEDASFLVQNKGSVPTAPDEEKWEGPKPGAASFMSATGKPRAASFMSAGNGKPRAASFLSGNRKQSFLAEPGAASFIEGAENVLLSVMPASLAAESRIADALQSDGHMKDTVSEAGELSCFLQKKSRFYSGSFIALAWRLRWCTIGKEDFTSCTGFQEGSAGDDSPAKLKFMNLSSAPPGTDGIPVVDR